MCASTNAGDHPISIEQFREYAREYDVVPVAREISFDTETAVTAYAKIRDGKHSFLLESVTGAEKWARYTFLGSRPREVVRVLKGKLERRDPEGGWRAIDTSLDPLSYLNQLLTARRPAPVPGIPRFSGGAVGYLGYDMVRYIEDLPDGPPNDLGVPEAVLIFTNVVLVIDNVFSRAIVVAMADVSDPLGPAETDARYHAALSDIDALISRLATPSDPSPRLLLPSRSQQAVDAGSAPASSYARADFERDVFRIQELIAAGDAFQVVLSQRFAQPTDASALDLYRVLRSMNPSPYLYLLELDDLALVGSSPEVLVRVEEGTVTVRPIAGTRRRGRDDAADAALGRELLADEKERAEHLMLLDLGRNDVGRVAAYGTVEVKARMQVERYSHVLHLVSQVDGRLRDGLTAIDVFRACFPAGTVSGAPKVRAMQIIDELEPVARGAYAGAVGYFGYGGLTMDTAIVIRTILLKAGIAYVHAGAGVVADSVPAREYEETQSKAAALLETLSHFDRVRRSPLTERPRRR